MMNNEVDKALEFISQHPEMIDVDIMKGITIIGICKNGYFKTISNLNMDMSVTLYPDDERYDEFKDRVNPNFPLDTSVEVDYEEFYGYIWTLAKTQYWFDYEIGFDIYGDTFEDFIMKFAKTLKYRYSDVNIDMYAKQHDLCWLDLKEIKEIWDEDKART